MNCRATILIRRSDHIHGKGLILVVTAGTSDIPVAEEALITARALGNRAEAVYDVGVAGLHRLLEYRKMLAAGASHHLRGRNGGGAAERGGGNGFGAGDRGADEHGLRIELRRFDGAARHVEQLCFERERGEHR